MKSADPEVVLKVSKSLDKTPIDTVAILDQVEADSDKFIVSTILDSYISLSNNFQSAVASLDRHEKTMAENNRLMEELKYELQVYKIAHQQSERSVRQLQSTESSRINTTTLGTFFLNHEDLVADFTLGDDDKILYKGEVPDSTNRAFMSLSFKMHDFFGNRNIQLHTLISGLKRYLIGKELNNKQYQHYLISLVEDYFSQQVTKTRTRVSLKYLRDACKDIPELDLPTIKSLMYSAGYPIKRDKNNTVYFYRRN
jgi:hypothetical protein